ncbi:MAG: response regulator transcription factor [Candidatus Bipolaricaulota bacterium]|nr:response regulator transcription factor [Candidatus Bipolaricaulota bacterium]
MASVRVVIGDDHGLVRSGVRSLLVAHGIDVVGEAADGRALLHIVREERPDVALVDLSMPLLDGFEAARRMSRVSPATRVVILTMHDDERFVARARQAGAAAYVLKDAAVDELVSTVSRVAAGERLLGTAAERLDDELTSREREILRLVLEGKKNAEIACILNRSVHTVRSHRAHLMRKLGIRSAADWVDAAERCGVATCSVPAGGLR